MKIAYIILVHKNPEQLARLINRLNVEDTFFSIHVDRNANQEDFEKEVFLKNDEQHNINFLKKRYKPKWGSFNNIHAVLELIDSVLDKTPDSIIFISGQDYPIMSNEDIKAYLEFYGGKALIEFEPASLGLETPNSTNRYYFSDYFNYNTSGFFNVKEVPLIARLLTKLLPKRPFIKGVKPFVGRQWFILPLEIAGYIVSESKKNKKLKKFYKYSIHASEMYFQTLLMNSHYADELVNLRITFANYNAPNPIVFRAADIKLLKAQDIPFARKFDAKVDENILDLIDSEILYK